MSLSRAQQVAFEEALIGKNLFITGPGGVGKSHVLSFIIKELRSRGKNVAVTASTGVAALLVGGCTLHSFTGAGLAKESVDDLLLKMNRNAKVKKRWKETDVLIIDEISMLNADFFSKVERIAKSLRRNFMQPFGGIQVILVGDFFQLPPVVKRGEVDLEGKIISSAFVFETETWKSLNPVPIVLSEPFRQVQKDGFFQCLSRIREGIHTEEDIRMLESRLNQDVSRDEIRPTELYSKNCDVDRMNELQLETLTNVQERTFKMLCSASWVPGVTKNAEKLKRVQDGAKKACPAYETLNLKIGAQVMLVANIDVAGGLANGSRGIVQDFEVDLNGRDVGVWVSFCGSPNEKDMIVVHPWTMEDPEIKVTVTQIPLILAWSITAHRSQGATLDVVSVSLDGSVFAEGQAYVALSRVRSLDGLCLTALDPKCIRSSAIVKAFYDNCCIHSDKNSSN